MHNCSEIINVFNACFKQELKTELVKGGEEPIYLPKTTYYPYHRVIFARGFYASALHEISHWCIAGNERRLKVDFGYWYKPDGRTESEQVEFERVEVKPQALEWILAQSAQHPFNVSLDNLSAGVENEQRIQMFKYNIWQQVQHYLEVGLPARAKQLSDALIEYYQRGPITASEFNLEAI
ncbi:elongation factor P hydroxylase [Bermanella sp. R86510]|uniref:elongation factor P hydroxylase n=1 Tax=unclassified Bermanella TaxID=2627862 RepID=UPI0037CAFC76